MCDRHNPRRIDPCLKEQILKLQEGGIMTLGETRRDSTISQRLKHEHALRHLLKEGHGKMRSQKGMLRGCGHMKWSEVKPSIRLMLRCAEFPCNVCNSPIRAGQTRYFLNGNLYHDFCSQGLEGRENIS